MLRFSLFLSALKGSVQDNEMACCRRLDKCRYVQRINRLSVHRRLSTANFYDCVKKKTLAYTTKNLGDRIVIKMVNFSGCVKKNYIKPKR